MCKTPTAWYVWVAPETECTDPRLRADWRSGNGWLGAQDAIGAVGIARCFTFGGHKKRALYDPALPPSDDDVSKQQYMATGREAPTMNHFYEKLFKLRGLMKTSAGRRLAEQRHAFMEQFVAQFYQEISGRG